MNILEHLEGGRRQERDFRIMINGPGGMQQAVAARQTQVGGDWFFWIAGASMVGSVLSLSGTSFHTALGLGTTAIIDSGVLPLSKSAALAISLFSAAFYVVYGFFARKGARWAFVVGGMFYLLDGFLLLSFRQWIGVAFHGYALFRIFQGFQAAQQLAALQKQSAGFSATGYVPPSSSPSQDVWPPPPGV